MEKKISKSHRSRPKGHILLCVLIAVLFIIVMVSLGFMVELIME